MLAACAAPLQDKRFSFADWPSLKASMPFHQVPVLQLEDGSQLAQMAAIGEHTRSAAKCPVLAKQLLHVETQQCCRFLQTATVLPSPA
jgi:glutathione S-transferase